MTVYIDKELCKSCSLCVRLCPRQVLAIGRTINKKGYNYAEVVRQEDCIGCRRCQTMCPDFAIYVEK